MLTNITGTMNKQSEHRKNIWRRFNGDSITLPIKDAVEQAIIRETDAGYKLKVCIGTDSQVKGEETEFATVIVFLREGGADLCSFTMKKQDKHFRSKNECWWK